MYYIISEYQTTRRWIQYCVVVCWKRGIGLKYVHFNCKSKKDSHLLTLETSKQQSVVASHFCHMCLLSLYRYLEELIEGENQTVKWKKNTLLLGLIRISTLKSLRKLLQCKKAQRTPVKGLWFNLLVPNLVPIYS